MHSDLKKYIDNIASELMILKSCFKDNFERQNLIDISEKDLSYLNKLSNDLHQFVNEIAKKKINK
jgi:hypothetical protein